MQEQHYLWLEQLDPAPQMEHWAALVALCWHGQHCLPKAIAAECTPSSESPEVAVLAGLLCEET